MQQNLYQLQHVTTARPSDSYSSDSPTVSKSHEIQTTKKITKSLWRPAVRVYFPSPAAASTSDRNAAVKKQHTVYNSLAMAAQRRSPLNLGRWRTRDHTPIHTGHKVAEIYLNKTLLHQNMQEDKQESRIRAKNRVQRVTNSIHWYPLKPM